MFSRQRTKILIVTGVLLLAFVVWQVVLYKSFRIISISPDPKNYVATSTENFTITFNKELSTSQDYNRQIASKESIATSVRIVGNKMIIDLGVLKTGNNYAFTLRDIAAKSGQIIPELSFNFGAKYIPYNELSRSEQVQQLSQTDVDAIEDPLDKFLPYSELGFYLTGAHTGLADDLKFTLHARIALSRADVNSGREAAIELQKRKIQEFIQSKDLDPGIYPITYEIVDPPF